jgi:hypothetical protein
MDIERTTRAQRRQTLAKLVLGHLIDIRIHTAPPRSEWKAEVHYSDWRNYDFIAADVGRENWPSETLCAKVALALAGPEYDSCAIRDLDDYTVDSVLGDHL